MNTLHKGFITPLLLALVALILPGGAYMYIHTKQATQSKIVSPITQATSTKNTTTPSITIFATLDILPVTMAFDTVGNLYAVDSGFNQITKPIIKISPLGVVTTIATVSAEIGALVFDRSNNLYGLKGNRGTVVKIGPQGSETTFATVGSQPQVMSFDTSGNLYTANLNFDTYRGSNNTNTISKITPSGTVTNSSTVDFENARGYGSEKDFSFPFALAFDSSGNLYASLGDKRIIKITPSSVQTTVATLDSLATSIAFDSSDNLYARGYNNISKITPSGTITTFATAKPSMDTPSHHLIVFDTFDNLYLADYSTTTGKTLITKVISTH